MPKGDSAGLGVYRNLNNDGTYPNYSSAGTDSIAKYVPLP